MPEPQVVVDVDAAASQEDVARVEQALERAELDSEVAAAWQNQPGVGNGLALAVVISFGAGFWGSFAGEAGKDAWKKLKELAWQLAVARTGSEETARGVHVSVVHPGGTEAYAPGWLPEEAFRQLLGLDWDMYRGGGLSWGPEGRWEYHPDAQHWDAEEKRWVD